MDRINTPDAVARRFVPGTPALGYLDATTIADTWLNQMQEEVLGLIEGSGQVASSANWGQAFLALQIVARGRVLLFTANASWVVPPNIIRGWAAVMGGGGAGGGAYGANSVGVSGGGGEYRWGVVPLTPGATLPITVGAGGVPGAPGLAGGYGGGSSLAGIITALGGGPGAGAAAGVIAGPSSVGGNGGVGGFAENGAGGGTGYAVGGGGYCTGPAGGPRGVMGPIANGNGSIAQPGSPGAGFGMGGSGGIAGGNGGAGYQGYVMVIF